MGWEEHQVCQLESTHLKYHQVLLLQVSGILPTSLGVGGGIRAWYTLSVQCIKIYSTRAPELQNYLFHDFLLVLIEYVHPL